jgi:hypothetical protein
MKDYSIGVVTYVERFDKSFKDLAFALAKQFPDIEKILSQMDFLIFQNN